MCVFVQNEDVVLYEEAAHRRFARVPLWRTISDLASVLSGPTVAATDLAGLFI